ncbi:MAG: WD40/YVTN/BNR-like repeat-containing protein [Thermoflexales bacterium]
MNWKHFDEPAAVFALAPQPGGACLAATEQGLWRFDPRRGGWQPIAPQFAHVPLTAVAACGPTWLIGASGDIAFSQDGGQNWQLAHLPVKARVLGLAVSPDFERDGVALAATAEDGVLRSADRGVTWHAWNYGLLDLGVNTIAVSPDFGEDATCFAASDHAVFMSINGGRAWQELPAPMAAGPFTSLTVATTPRGPALYAGTEGNGLWASVAPFEAWRRVKGLRADEVNFVLPGWAATTVGLYFAAGGRWRRALARPDVVCMALLDDGALVAGAAGSGVWYGAAD